MDQFVAAILQMCDFVRELFYPEPLPTNVNQQEETETETETYETSSEDDVEVVPFEQPPATVEELNRQLGEIKDEYLKSVVEIDWYHAQASAATQQSVVV